MARPSICNQTVWRLGVLPWNQSHDSASLRASAMDQSRSRAGHEHGALGPAPRTRRNLVGAIEGMVAIYRALPVSPPARAFRGGYLLSRSRKFSATMADAWQNQGTTRLQLRCLSRRCAAHAHVSQKRAARAAGRHELSRARSA